MALNQTVAPVSEPITTAEAKAFLKVQHDADDAVIDTLIKHVRDVCEHHCQRQLMTATWRLTLDSFPGGSDGIILIPPPLQSVTSVSYVDAAGTTQTLSSSLYAVDARTDPGWLVPAEDEEWPETDEVINAVTVTYQAGYASREAVPADLKALMLAHLAQLYDKRAGPWELDHLIQGYRRWWHGCRTGNV